MSGLEYLKPGLTSEERAWLFIERVWEECQNDIECKEMPVPGDLCLWTIRSEARTLLDERRKSG